MGAGEQDAHWVEVEALLEHDSVAVVQVALRDVLVKGNYQIMASIITVRHRWWKGALS